MEIRETVEWLNELLEVERAGVAAAEDLIPMATSPAMSRLFAKLRDDEVWSCAGLMRVIRHLGGKVSPGQSELGGPLETVPSLRARLASLNRRQTWVLRRLDRRIDCLRVPPHHTARPVSILSEVMVTSDGGYQNVRIYEGPWSLFTDPGNCFLVPILIPAPLR